MTWTLDLRQHGRRRAPERRPRPGHAAGRLRVRLELVVAVARAPTVIPRPRHDRALERRRRSRPSTPAGRDDHGHRARGRGHGRHRHPPQQTFTNNALLAARTRAGRTYTPPRRARSIVQAPRHHARQDGRQDVRLDRCRARRHLHAHAALGRQRACSQRPRVRPVPDRRDRAADAVGQGGTYGAVRRRSPPSPATTRARPSSTRRWRSSTNVVPAAEHGHGHAEREEHASR